MAPRRRPPGAVPRAPNSPRTCPWSVLPLSLPRPEDESFPPRENRIKSSSLSLFPSTRPLNFPDAREIQSIRVYKHSSHSRNSSHVYPSHNNICSKHRTADLHHRREEERKHRRIRERRAYVTHRFADDQVDVSRDRVLWRTTTTTTATATAASRTRRRPSVVVSRRGMKFARGLGWVSPASGSCAASERARRERRERVGDREGGEEKRGARGMENEKERASELTAGGREWEGAREV